MAKLIAISMFAKQHLMAQLCIPPDIYVINFTTAADRKPISILNDTSKLYVVLISQHCVTHYLDHPGGTSDMLRNA